jgi:hypothetical protein
MSQKKLLVPDEPVVFFVFNKVLPKRKHPDYILNSQGVLPLLLKV